MEAALAKGRCSGGGKSNPRHSARRFPVVHRWFRYPVQEVPRLDAEEADEGDQLVYSRVRDGSLSCAGHLVLGENARDHASYLGVGVACSGLLGDGSAAFLVCWDFLPTTLTVAFAIFSAGLALHVW
jgi:hypothetical protein